MQLAHGVLSQVEGAAESADDLAWVLSFIDPDLLHVLLVELDLEDA